MADVTVSNFIMEHKNALDDDFCENLISEAKGHIKIAGELSNDAARASYGVGSGLHQFENELMRQDLQVFMPQHMQTSFVRCQEIVYKSFQHYQGFISSLQGETLASCVAKVQCTPVSGGYHVWHKEQQAGAENSRAIAWMAYLNDVENGGETEFLYQQVKVKPTKGTMLMWPAGFTHPHRGNPPYSNEKWILTGWLIYPSMQFSNQEIPRIDDGKG